MSTFFAAEMSPNSEVSKMSIGEMYNRINEGELGVPNFQRDYVWTSKQQQSYLESISEGLPLFGPVINIDNESGKQFIMDGQNRLYTIYNFMNDEITFDNESGEKIKYSEMTPSSQRKFKNIKISYTETHNWTREQCQEFFMVIQEGTPLKNGELIHAKPENPFTKTIVKIYEMFTPLFNNSPENKGMSFSPSSIKRFGHYEIIGTLIRMTRTDEYPGRPGKTALKEFKSWSNNDIPTQSDRDECIDKTIMCLDKYSNIIENVPRLQIKKGKLNIPGHLRLLYFIYKSNIYLKDLTDEEYSKIEKILNRVLNKSNPEYNQIVLWGTTDVEEIYKLYLKIYNE